MHLWPIGRNWQIIISVSFPVPSLVLGRAEHQIDAVSLEQLSKVYSLNANLFSCAVAQCVAHARTCP